MKNLKELGQAIRQARKAKKLTLDALAEITGISKPYLSNIENATLIGPPSSEKLSKLAQALNMNEAQLTQAGDWLRTPESVRNLLLGGQSQSASASAPRRSDGTVNLDALLKNTSASQSVQELSATPQDDTLRIMPVPLINRVPAGKPVEYTDLEYPPGVADSYVSGVTKTRGKPGSRASQADQQDISGAVIALRVTGDSMEPEYKNGDIVQFSAETPRDGDDCLVRLGELEGFAQTFKRVFFITETEEGAEPKQVGVKLVPLNPKYEIREFRIDEISGIFPAIWKMTSTRKNT